MNGTIIKTMLINFVIWLIPTAIFLVFSIVVLAILMMAAADVSSASQKKDPFEKWPKGFIGSLGIGFWLSALACLGSFFYFDNIDTQGVIFIVGMAIVCSLFGYWAVKYDYNRLKKNIETLN